MILIIGKPETFESKKILSSLQAKGLDFDFLSWREITLPADFTPYKILVVRTPPPLYYKDMIPLLLTLIEQAEAQRIKVIPSSESLRKCDKYSLYSVTRKRLPKLEIPPTILTSNLRDAGGFLERYKTAICKPLVGGGGKGIFKISYPGNAVVAEELRKNGYILLQKFIDNLGYDIRTVIIGDEVASQYVRMNPYDFRYNIHLGATSIPKKAFLESNPKAEAAFKEAEKASLQVKRILGLEMCGVDTLPGKEGVIYFLEANPFFGFKGAVEDVAGKIADYLDSLVKSYFR